VTASLIGALPRASKGAVVALDPRDGSVLAMVSFPSYDPNQLAAHDQQALLEGGELLLEVRDDAIGISHRYLARWRGPATGR